MSGPRILVVDDELSIRRLVAAVLTRGGFEPLEAADARKGLTFVGSRLSAVIVDLGLPDRDGLELVAAFAARGIPTLVLSARQDTADKVAALDLGADDYLTKPFDGDELLARLRVLLRRSASPSGEVLTHGPLRINPGFHQATLNGRALDLTPREFALLQALVAGAGRVLTHRTLLEQVWGPAHVDDLEYLRVAVRALRRKIEADPARPELVLNIPGVGYRLAG